MRAVVLLLAMSCCARGQEAKNPSQTPPETVPVKVSLCQLLNKPELYNGKEVVVRALYNHGYEWSVLSSPECSSQKDLVWLDTSHVGDKSYRKAVGGLDNTDTFNLTVRGIFMSGGPYGHLGAYQREIIAHELKDVQKLRPQK